MLEKELKIRISPEMCQEIDQLVSRRPEGVNRSDIVREALTLYLADQLHQSGKDDLRHTARGIKQRLRQK